MAVILQVDFTVPSHLLGNNLSKVATELAESIKNEPGFISKIWTENLNSGEAGGIYFFEDEQAAQHYLEMHQKRLHEMGAINLHSKIFTINEPLTEITKGQLNW